MRLRIKDLQKRKNIKNVELAQMIGVSNQQVANYNSKNRVPPISTLEKIAQALNCEIVELFPLSDEFYHSYDDKGEWQGIMRKPKYIPTPAEIASIKQGLEDIKEGRVFTEEEVEAEMEQILWEK